jgi:hypothetical protein
MKNQIKNGFKLLKINCLQSKKYPNKDQTFLKNGLLLK